MKISRYRERFALELSIVHRFPWMAAMRASWPRHYAGVGMGRQDIAIPTRRWRVGRHQRRAAGRIIIFLYYPKSRLAAVNEPAFC
jgi:hypothetical protein